MQLRPFQIMGSDFLASRDFALFCDDAGLGKSAQVLDAVKWHDLSRVLCIGPAVAGVSWPLEIVTWGAKLSFVNLDLGRGFGFDLPGFYFVSYDMLSQKSNAALVAELASCPTWDAIVLDEGQYLKNPGSNRTKAVYGEKCDRGPDAITSNTRRVWVLSGTITPNHAGEIYPHMAALFPAVLRDLGTPEQYQFEDKFCVVRDTVYGRSIQGSKNQSILRAAMAPHLLRRRKADVMPELAPMEWFTAPIDCPVLSLPEPLQDPRGAYHDDGVEILAEQIEQHPRLSSARRELGLAKVPGCVAWVRQRLESGEPKVIVFAHHTDVLQGLYDDLLDYNPVIFRGSTPEAERVAAVDLFQHSKVCRVFVGQIVAAGTAITLTAAKCVFFAEYAGTPGVNYQAASRAHRIGQSDGVQVYFGSVPNSLDGRIASTAARRAREIAELFD